MIVTWRDAFFEYEQSSTERSVEDYIVRTAGYLIAEDELFVSIAGEILPDDRGFRAVTHIPRRFLLDVDLPPATG